MKRFFRDLKKYIMFTFVSAKSQLKAEVANSYLNWVWWILEPICFMFIYVLVFGGLFGAKTTNFPVFIFVGITIWDFFSRMLNVSVQLVRNNQAIVSKVYIPKFVLLMTKVWVNGFKMMISIGIVVGMMFFYKIPVTLNGLYILPILLTLVLLSFGIGTILMHFGVFVDDLSKVVSIVLRALFYLTGIFYDIATRFEAPYNVFMLKANPVAFLIGASRDVLLYGKQPDMVCLTIWFGVSLLVLYCGIQTIYKNENSYVKVL